jgi:signal transduction histidine kinase
MNAMLLEVQFDHKLIAQLFDLQPDAVVWYAPVFLDDEISDFEYRYCNSAASRMFGVPVHEVTGTPLKECSFLDEVTRSLIFEQCLTVFNGGEPVEFTYYSPVFSSYLNVQRSKALNGILSVTRDRTAQVMAEQERQRQSNLLRTITNASPTSIVLCEAVRDTQGRVHDFRLITVNDKTAQYLQRPKEEIESMTYRGLYPEVNTNGLLDILAHVVNTGFSFKEEIYLEGFGGWFLLTASRVEEERVLAIYLDINETKKDKIALQQQAEWFNNILSYSPNGIIAMESVRDNTGEIIDFEIRLANKAGKTMANLPANPVGKRLLDVFPELRNDASFEFPKKVVETGIPYRNDLPFLTGATKRWFQVSLVKLDDGLISNFMDITEIKNFEQTIQEQANELKSILDASLNGLFACECVHNENGEIIDFRFIKINSAFTQILKLEEKDVIGKLYSVVFPAIKNTDIIQLHADVVRTGKPMQTEMYYKDEAIDGWFFLSISKWGEDGFVQSFYDYTKLKQLQQQLELTIQGLKRSNERLTEFSHVASHDLNEPLRKVITFSKLLNDKYGPSLETGARDYLDRIEKTAVRMQVLLENLLIYSRVSKQINSFEQVGLNNVVQEVLSDLETVVTQKNAIIKTDALPTITGERTQLRQLFQNLISNALKFQVAGNQPVIQIRHTRTGSAVIPFEPDKVFHIIEITDNGIGFAPSEAEKIFQLFHRLHARHEYEGTGIGLAIVQRAMENHHGFAEAFGEENQGSTFRLYFPR